MFFCVILIKVAWLAEKQEMPDLSKICQNTHPWIHHSKIYGMKPFISRHARKKMLDRTTKFLTTLASPEEVHSNNNIKISLLCEIAICRYSKIIYYVKLMYNLWIVQTNMHPCFELAICVLPDQSLDCLLNLWIE